MGEEQLPKKKKDLQNLPLYDVFLVFHSHNNIQTLYFSMLTSNKSIFLVHGGYKYLMVV